MKSCYGSKKFNGDLITTLNGRPSEIIGRLVCKLILRNNALKKLSILIPLRS